jgi:hypothetical protein
MRLVISHWLLVICDIFWCIYISSQSSVLVGRLPVQIEICKKQILICNSGKFDNLEKLNLLSYHFTEIQSGIVMKSLDI